MKCSIRLKSILTFILLFLIIVAISCKKDEDLVKSNITTETIGPEGGAIVTEQGVLLTIPEGVLDEPTEISLEVIEESKNFPSGNNQLTGFVCGVVLKPDELQFNKPVTLTMPLENGSDSGSVYYYNATDDIWDLIANPSIDIVNSSISVSLEHFSAYASTVLTQQILNKLDDLLRTYSNPETAVNLYADYLINTIKIMELYDNIHGCCYKVVGFFINGDYKFNDIEGSFSKKHGETTGAHEATYLSGMTDKSTSDGYVELISKYLTVYFKCDAGITVSAKKEELDVDEKTEITAVLKCDEKSLPNKKVVFETSVEGVLSKTEATTNENGEAKVTFTAKKNGIALITASYNACECKSEEKNVTENVTIIIGDYETEYWEGQLVIDVSNNVPKYTDEYMPTIKDIITVNFSFTYDPAKAALFDPFNHPCIQGTGSLSHLLTTKDGAVKYHESYSEQWYYKDVSGHNPALNVSGSLLASLHGKIISITLGRGECLDLITGFKCEKITNPTEIYCSDFIVYWPFQLRKKEAESSYGLTIPLQDGATYSGICHDGGFCPAFRARCFEGTFTVTIWKSVIGK